jgi:tRNA(adenine34) deaminase
MSNTGVPDVRLSRKLKKLVARWQIQPRDEVDTKLAALAVRLMKFQPTCPHDPFIMLAIEQALLVADVGNPAIGAVLVDPSGNVVDGAGPRNVKPYFRSDLHAEMQLITTFENRCRFRNQAAVVEAMAGMTLYSSLEPCTMCTARLIMSGVTNCYHAADDSAGGMVNAQDRLPPVWGQLIQAGNKQFARADCSQELRDISFEAFLVTIMATGRTDLWPDAHC